MQPNLAVEQLRSHIRSRLGPTIRGIPWLWEHRNKPLVRLLIGKPTPAKKGKRKSPSTAPSAPDVLMESLLWGGFASHAIRMLEERKQTRWNTGPLFSPAWSLARIYLDRGDYARAFDNLLIARAANPDAASTEAFEICGVEILRRMGRAEAGIARLSRIIESGRETPRYCMMMSSLLGSREDSSAERLRWINKTLQNFSPLKLRDDSRPLHINNIEVDAPIDPQSSAAKVSILMPAFNAEAHIATSIRSVLNQTWENIELVVIDDCSTDRTWQIIQNFAQQDSRVIAVQQDSNRGAYFARNRALDLATGDFVTVNDADDWVHPEKIASQVKPLLIAPNTMNSTYGCRVLEDLTVSIKPQSGRIFAQNTSSIMAATHHFRELGGWDEVQIGADAEMINRLTQKLGSGEKKIARTSPLAFILTRDDSLTKGKFTGNLSIPYGVRREYKEAAAHWRASTGELTVKRGRRGFAAPRLALTRDNSPQKVQILFVSDLSLPGGTNSSNLALFDAAEAAQITFGIYHLPRADKHGNSVNPKVRSYLHNTHRTLLVPGEEIHADVIVVNHPPVLMAVPDLRSTFKTNHCIVVANQAPRTHSIGGKEVYSPSVVRQNAQVMFGVDPVLAPLSPLIRNLLIEEGEKRLTDENWFPLLDRSTWNQLQSARSFDNTRKPVIGRHSRDAPDKWLVEPSEIKKAYFVGTNTPVRILGGAESAKKRLGLMPENWEVIPFGAMEPTNFLSTIDFFVYYTDPHMIEAFGRAPMEAMASGVPVILPDVFRSTFGDAAIYAEPENVQSIVSHLWSNQEKYEAQRKQGYEFVRKNCSPCALKGRVERYILFG